MDAIAGASAQLAADRRASAATTTGNTGATPMITAAAAIASIAMTAALALLSLASTKAPAGTWAASTTPVPMLKASPICSGFQRRAVR
jgi:hypothetical protein